MRCCCVWAFVPSVLPYDGHDRENHASHENTCDVYGLEGTKRGGKQPHRDKQQQQEQQQKRDQSSRLARDQRPPNDRNPSLKQSFPLQRPLRVLTRSLAHRCREASIWRSNCAYNLSRLSEVLATENTMTSTRRCLRTHCGERVSLVGARGSRKRARSIDQCEGLNAYRKKRWNRGSSSSIMIRRHSNVAIW